VVDASFDSPEVRLEGEGDSEAFDEPEADATDDEEDRRDRFRREVFALC
jgi:hypothetical protein